MMTKKVTDCKTEQCGRVCCSYLAHPTQMRPSHVPSIAAHALAAVGKVHSTTAMREGAASYSYTRIVKPLLLVSDLDDTLLGSTPAADAATAAFKHIWERSKASSARCTLAINTGRTLPLWEAAWAAKSGLLPQPDVLIAGVGTRCYHHTPELGGWREDEGWTARMQEGWDIGTARSVIEDLICTFGDSNVEYRPDAEMHCHKLTVLYRKSLKEQLMPSLHSSLQKVGLQATVIEGGSGRGPDWQFIDLLPAAAGKGSAMRYIQKQLQFDDASTVAAGDANNDLLMLQQAPQAILVGNAVPELKAWAGTQPTLVKQQQQQQEGSCGVQHQPVVYIAEQCVAAGVIEGLEAFGMLQTELAN